MTVKLSGSLPGDEANGLDVLQGDLLSTQPGDVVVVAVARLTKIATDVEKGEQHPTVRLVRVEAIRDDLARGTAEQLMQGAYEARTGNEALDLADLEETDA